MTGVGQNLKSRQKYEKMKIFEKITENFPKSKIISHRRSKV